MKKLMKSTLFLCAVIAASLSACADPVALRSINGNASGLTSDGTTLNGTTTVNGPLTSSSYLSSQTITNLDFLYFSGGSIARELAHINGGNHWKTWEFSVPTYTGTTPSSLNFNAPVTAYSVTVSNVVANAGKDLHVQADANQSIRYDFAGTPYYNFKTNGVQPFFSFDNFLDSGASNARWRRIWAGTAVATPTVEYYGGGTSNGVSAYVTNYFYGDFPLGAVDYYHWNGENGDYELTLRIDNTGVQYPIDLISINGSHNLVGFNRGQFNGGYLGGDAPGAEPWDINSDGSARFANGAATISNTGVFGGDGSGLTSLSGSQLAAQSVPNSALDPATNPNSTNYVAWTNAPIQIASGQSLVSTGGTNAFGSPTFKLVYHTNTLKFNFPRYVDGTGCTIPNTNDFTADTFMVPLFSNSGASNANYMRFAVRVPWDLDTSADLTASLTVANKTSNSGDQQYHIGMVCTPSDGAIGSIANKVPFLLGGILLGTSGYIQTKDGITLTGWKSALTPGQWWLIELGRGGSDPHDPSSTDTYFKELEISYKSTR
jgi:hypothetical protein